MHATALLDAPAKTEFAPILSPAPAATRIMPLAGTGALYRYMHPGVYAVGVVGWIALLATYWLTFGADLEAAFMVAISTLFFVAFFTLPLALFWMTPFRREALPPGLAAFLRGEIDTHTGPLNGAAALVQVVIVPVVLSLATMAMGVIVVTTQ